MTVGRRVLALLLLILPASAPGSAQIGPGPGPVRIVLLVDSSGTVAQMVPQFRAGMNAFLDALPGDPRIAIISTGGQIRVRVPPTTDRAMLRDAANRFASDGGGNSFLDTMLEADKRFLRIAPDERSIFVILMTDNGADIRGDARIDEYNRFVSDFLRRGGRAHGIVIRGVNVGLTTDVLMNLTKNTNGFYDSLTVANPLAERMKVVAEMVAVDMP